MCIYVYIYIYTHIHTYIIRLHPLGILGCPRNLHARAFDDYYIVTNTMVTLLLLLLC